MKVLLMADHQHRTPPSKTKTSKSKTSNGASSPTRSSKSSKAKQSFSNPSFQLPADFDNDPGRYELWTVRLPKEIALGDLDGIRVPLNHRQDGGGEIFESGEKRYHISLGSQLENESCRLLVPAKTTAKRKRRDNDDESDEDNSEEEEEKEKEGFLYPSLRPFSRHLNVLEHFPSLGERTLAPPLAEAPSPKDSLRRAYAPVPQRTNLRQRWQMPGARVETKRDSDDTVLLTKPRRKRKLSEVDSLSAKAPPPSTLANEEQKPAANGKLDEESFVRAEKADASDTESSSRKAAKRAKKEAKKAKKEAKKARKEQKKIKKEPK